MEQLLERFQEEVIRKYIQDQEREDRRIDQLKLLS